MYGAPRRASLPDWGAHSPLGNHCLLDTLPSRYIVYDTAQVNLKYLLKLKFNFKTSLW